MITKFTLQIDEIYLRQWGFWPDYPRHERDATAQLNQRLACFNPINFCTSDYQR